MAELKDGFDHPSSDIDGLQMALGADLTKDSLIPPYLDIPEEFRRERGDARPWLKIQSDWFFHGLKDKGEFVAKKDIDAGDAWSHLATIQGSWDPKHEHKMAAVAWLMSRWFELPKARR